MAWSMVAVLGASLTGCGSDPSLRYSVDEPGNLHPVAGKVLFNGRPIEGARLVFFDTSADAQSANYGDIENPDLVIIRPRASTGPDGSFEVQTAGPGAPAGEYLVTVSWKGVVPPGTDPDEAPEKLPKKYQNPQQSGLKVTIKPGDNVLPAFDLK